MIGSKLGFALGLVFGVVLCCCCGFALVDKLQKVRVFYEVMTLDRIVFHEEGGIAVLGDTYGIPFQVEKLHGEDCERKYVVWHYVKK